MLIVLSDRPDLASIVRLVSKKRKAYLATPASQVRLAGTYWDEGSRCDYYLIDLASKQVTPLGHVSPPHFGGPREDPIQPLRKGLAVICAGTSSGKPATPVVYFSPEE
jgi:hypothetical protein